MIQALKSSKEIPIDYSNVKEKDLIILKKIERQEMNENGDIVLKKSYQKTNLTRLINETAKIVKQTTVKTAEQKLREMEKIFTK